MSSSTTCSVVDDYAVMFNGALYIRKVNKDATPEEKKQRRAQYMKRYRSGRKAVKKEGAQKEEQGDDTEVHMEMVKKLLVTRLTTVNLCAAVRGEFLDWKRAGMRE